MLYMPLHSLEDFVVDIAAKEKMVEFLNNLLAKKRKPSDGKKSDKFKHTNTLDGKKSDKFKHTNTFGGKNRQGKVVRRYSQTRRG